MIESKKEALALFHRQNILAAAEKLFLAKGFDKTTMDDIAKEAQYSKATLYVYFKNKDEIINSLTLESMKQLYEHLHEAYEHHSDLFSHYKAMCYELVAYQESMPLYFDIAISPINVDIDNPETPSIFKEIYEMGEKVNKEVGVFITEGISKGYFKEDLDIFQTIMWFWGSITGLIKVAASKQEFIHKCSTSTKNDFLDYSFKLLLSSVLKEGVKNEY